MAKSDYDKSGHLTREAQHRNHRERSQTLQEARANFRAKHPSTITRRRESRVNYDKPIKVQ